MPTDVQALTVLQDLLSDDFQMKNTHSTQRSYYKTYKSHSKYILQIESNSINSIIRNRLLLQFIHFRKVLLEAEAFHSLTRLPETTFYMKKSTRILQFCILRGYPYRKEILHLEGKEIFEYFQSSYSTHPCMLQDLPKAFQTFRTFSHSRQNSTYFRTSRDSTLLQHSLTRMHILHITWFPQKTPPSTSWTFRKFQLLQRKRDVAISAISNSFEIINMLTTIHSFSGKQWMTQRQSVYELSSWHITQLMCVKCVKNSWMTISSVKSLSYYNSCQEQLSPFLVKTSESLLMSIVAFVYKLLWFPFQITSTLYSNVSRYLLE